ncbi:hypothetical protein MED92_14403 [Oceanospirillum sp. MED92]|uniref:Uncharacterized protein n=1 Tax=Neptuniibacter caesariensis TaxID=207954 RepID=A0A7U8C7T2_NEPCE|nr:hypothetical protein MED92_14403 [Oceanospirillum sp. MED92] [Neptuniibacter caesariensis]
MLNQNKETPAPQDDEEGSVYILSDN